MRQHLSFFFKRLYLGLLSLYPQRFRANFGEEIQEIFLRIADEVEEVGNFELLSLYSRELRSLVVSIMREQWLELKSGKEKDMAPENDLREVHDFQNGEVSLVVTGSPDLGWIFRWTLLTTGAIIAGWLVTGPFTAVLLFIAKLGTNLGLLTGVSGDTLMPVGFFTGLALTYAAAQWLMLRHYLPRVRSWFLATGAGFLAAGLLIVGAVSIIDSLKVNSSWGVVVYFLLLGGAVGVAQWMILRKILRNAFWILVIDVLAAGSFLLIGDAITSLIEFLAILLLPGLVTGIGIWILLKRSQQVMESKIHETIPVTTGRRAKKLLWFVLGSVSLIPLFFICIWVYAISQIEIAKSRGIYATAEEAVIGHNSQGWGGAEVLNLAGVHAGPNSGGGVQPHVWFGGCTVTLDRVPQGWDRTHYLAGSFYLHVREGWVHVPEGAFPEYIGWVMELYDLEDVKEWIAENK